MTRSSLFTHRASRRSSLPEGGHLLGLGRRLVGGRGRGGRLVRGSGSLVRGHGSGGRRLIRGHGGGGRCLVSRGTAGSTLVLGHGGAARAGKLGTVKVGIGQLDTLNVVLLVHERLAIIEQLIDAHGGLGEVHLLPGVHELLGQPLDASGLDELTDSVIVHAGAESAEEIDRLAGESVHNLRDLVTGDTVILEDTGGDTDAVLARGVPVELLHATVADEGRVQGGEIVTGADNRDTGDGVLLVGTGELHVGGVVSDVHQGGVHHLVVDSVLSRATHASRTGIKIVDEERAHLALLDDVRRLPVTLTDELRGLTGVAGLELTSRHHDGGDAELLEGQLDLESLALTLTTPDTEDQGHLELGEIEVVLHDVHGELVQESGGDVVVTVDGDVLQALGGVIGRGHDGVSCALHTVAALEQLVNHTAAASDVLLVIGIVGKVTRPLVELGHHAGLGAVGHLESGLGNRGAGGQAHIVSLGHKGGGESGLQSERHFS
mmetsp:Transcript_16770/g.36477  ORF Transcript_16770/g.36477 Transcript_16770/m.36477 type:complete len:491 (+) Transcript_16770:122-1594(+)